MTFWVYDLNMDQAPKHNPQKFKQVAFHRFDDFETARTFKNLAEVDGPKMKIRRRQGDVFDVVVYGPLSSAPVQLVATSEATADLKEPKSRSKKKR